VVSQGHHVDLAALMRGHGWDDAVIKPAIGGTARLAVHVDAIGTDAAQRHLDEMLANEDAIVQRFVPSVPAVGETSVIAIGGVVTHAVHKRATAGEWRVHAEFGGCSELIALDDRLTAAARTAIAAIQPTPTYARVDLVEGSTGELQLIELELVEPELFFRLAADAATRLAHHVLTRCG